MDIVNITNPNNDNDNNSLCNCTNDGNNMILEISPLFLIISVIPCALSIICCLSILLYNFIKDLINKK